MFVISLQPSLMSCPAEGGPGWLSISPASSKGAKTDAEGKNAEGGLNGGLVSTVLAHLTFLQVSSSGVWGSAVDLTALTMPSFKLMGGVENVPLAEGCNEAAAWAVRRLLDVWFLGPLLMWGWWRPFWRWRFASQRHSNTKSWLSTHVKSWRHVPWRREMNPHPPLRSARRPLQWCVSIGLSKLCLTG